LYCKRIRPNRLQNTNAVVFKEPTDKELYVHVDDGWFRAWTTDGPWERVPENALPADLAEFRSLTVDML
jgi:hypothetical protein